MSVIVKIPEPGGKTANRGGHFQRFRHVGKRTILVIAIQPVGLLQVAHIEIRKPILIEIAPANTLGISQVGHTRLRSYVGKGPIPVVPKQLARRGQLCPSFITNV